MNPEAYRYVLLGALAGGLVGALVMWSRQKTPAGSLGVWRKGMVLMGGTGAIGVALFAFGQAFGTNSMIQGSLVTVLVTAWVSVIGSVVRLPAPARLLRVFPGEPTWLRSRWSGVRPFGALLRRTPLRRLGGRVYLAEAGGDFRVVVEDMLAAEKVHLWALVCSTPWILHWIVQDRLPTAGGALLVHVPLNLLPVLHLRLAIWRTERGWERLERRRPPGDHGSTRL